MRAPAAAIAVVLVGTASAGTHPAQLRRSPRRSWSGTVTYVATSHLKHTQTAGDSVTQDETYKLTITQDGFEAHATASYELRSMETYFHCNTLSGVKTTVDQGSSSAKVDLSRVERDPQTGRFEITTDSVDVAATSTTTTQAPGSGVNCPPDNQSSTEKTSHLVRIALPMSSPFKPPNAVVAGRAENHDPPSSACSSPGYECGASTTVTWAFHRLKLLTIDELKLYDRDPFYSTRTKSEINHHVFPPEFSPLEYLSTSPHPWFGHVTTIYGTAKIDGFAEDGLKKIVLEIEDEDGTVATAPLADDVHGDLIRSFGDGAATVDKPNLMFTLPAAQAAKLDRSQTQNQKLTLRVRAVSDLGDETVHIARRVQDLVRFELGESHRYGNNGTAFDRDPEYGGDSWLTPEARRHLTAITAHARIRFRWGDMSNMNGGRFYPHASHRAGLDADGKFPDFYKQSECTTICFPTAYAASVLVALLRSPYGAPIEKIFVTFKETELRNGGFKAPGAFYTELLHENADPLPDGRHVLDVIRYEESHDTHFHIRFKG